MFIVIDYCSDNECNDLATVSCNYDYAVEEPICSCHENFTGKYCESKIFIVLMLLKIKSGK